MSDTLSRRAVIFATALAVVLVAAVVVLGRVLDEPEPPAPLVATGPLPLVPVEAPSATSPDCAALLGALPGELPSGSEVLRTQEIAAPAPDGTRAWGTRDAPVVLRCGLHRPPELTPTSTLRAVSGVQWLPIEGDTATSFFAVDRAVVVALTVPLGSGTGVLQVVSESLGRALAPKPVF